jgi:heme iron utilization protein
MSVRSHRAGRDKEPSQWAMPQCFKDLRFAVLATSDGGKPYTSLIAYALTPDCQTVIFATKKATQKYRNLKEQPSVSILIDNRSQTPEDLGRAEAVTLLGTASLVRVGARREEFAAVFTARHPQLTAFVNDPGTALLAMTIEQAVHVTQFQNVSFWARGT